MRPPKWLTRMTRAQLFWAFSGIGIIVVVAAVARGNLTKIYDAQPDFFLGSLLALTGFCFAKAFSRTNVTTALELIRDGRTQEVSEAVEQEIQRRLHAKGVHQQIALLNRNISAANKRTCEYYDLQTKEPRFYITAPLLRVALQDLDEALGNVTQLGHAVGSKDAQIVHTLPSDVRSQLSDALRDLQEASARRNETYETLLGQFDTIPIDELWGAFTVMTSDTLKAVRDLEALLGRNIMSPPKERCVVLAGYVAASLKRARRVEELIEEKGLAEPSAMKVLIEDLERVLEKLSQIEFGGAMLVGGPSAR
ncbi:hypothetical protein [Streptosporangium sp. KLBMP 9127]|nr:hypothetical protein [Streptosporangium sp. KLBMP 9127]